MEREGLINPHYKAGYCFPKQHIKLNASHGIREYVTTNKLKAWTKSWKLYHPSLTRLHSFINWYFWYLSRENIAASTYNEDNPIRTVLVIGFVYLFFFFLIESGAVNEVREADNNVHYIFKEFSLTVVIYTLFFKFLCRT